MRLYIPWPTATGYAVAYMNHRGEMMAVMECPTLQMAYEEAALMTQASMQQTAPGLTSGNRYLRRFS